MLSGALLGILEEAGAAVLTLSDGLSKEEFFATRLTQREVLRQLRIMAESSANVPAGAKAQLAEIDWAGWAGLALQLKVGGESEREAIWFGVCSLVPAMLIWLQVYRQNQPEIFSFTA